MNAQDYELGKSVKVVKDDGTKGMLIAPKHLAIRTIGQTGTIYGIVPGHGGNIWWVEQRNGIAAYCFTELEPASTLN